MLRATTLLTGRTPDEFCRLAGVVEGAVKVCMIEKQEASLVALLRGPQVAATNSSWGLWRNIGHPAIEQHLLQFVNLLEGSDFGNAYFSHDLMQASHFPCSASTASVAVLSTNADHVLRL
ncbi:uncharacterized protein [Physcomitrium patens]|uniref:uncharacterized protein isoform X2 n=1 Tax=Physcomitrium patens TaxID=3218 RepID=UPI003CCDEF44